MAMQTQLDDIFTHMAGMLDSSAIIPLLSSDGLKQ